MTAAVSRRRGAHAGCHGCRGQGILVRALLRRLAFNGPCIGVFALGLLSCATSGDGSSSSAQTLGDADTTGDTTATVSTSGADTVGTDSSASASATSTTTESTGEADTTSGTPSWNRYTLDVDAGTWTVTPLDELWTGANAPPPTGISAAVSLTHFDRLWVVTADGTFYEQADGVWSTPVALQERFPMLVGLDVGAMTHTPGQMSTTEEDVYFIDNPTAVIYTQHENGGLDFVDVAMLQDEPGAAPQGTGRAQWYFAITDPQLIGMSADWLQWYVAYDDGNLWKFNAAFEWTSWPLTDNDFFTGAPLQPDPTQIEAAYHDDAFGRVHLIGP